MGLFSKLKDKFSKKEDVKEEKIQEKYDKGLEKTRESFFFIFVGQKIYEGK